MSKLHDERNIKSLRGILLNVRCEAASNYKISGVTKPNESTNASFPIRCIPSKV